MVLVTGYQWPLWVGPLTIFSAITKGRYSMNATLMQLEFIAALLRQINLVELINQHEMYRL